MKRETIENLIWIFCIITFIGLSMKIEIDSTKYSCDKCVVTFYNKMASTEEYYKFGVYDVDELFYEYLDGHCSIKWDYTQGHYNNGYAE